MVIVKLKYITSLEIVEQYLQAHRDFLIKHYDTGIFLASGPMIPRTGGVIISLLDKASTEEVIKSDPFFINNIATYSLVNFEPVLYHDSIKPLMHNL